MILNISTDLKGIQDMALKMKDATMAAHDVILNARIAQTTQANKHQKESLFKVDDFVYVSTKNMSLPVWKSAQALSQIHWTLQNHTGSKQER